MPATDLAYGVACPPMLAILGRGLTCPRWGYDRHQHAGDRLHCARSAFAWWSLDLPVDPGQVNVPVDLGAPDVPGRRNPRELMGMHDNGRNGWVPPALSPES